MCAMVKDKAAEFFSPRQMGLACRTGAEKVTHALRQYIEEHWMDEDFVTFKVDMKNAFNIVSSSQVCHPLSCCYGPILCCRTHLARSAQSLEPCELKMGPALDLHVN
eukprot:Em0015g647a